LKTEAELKKLKVALYSRVSTDDKRQDPVNQLRQLREFSKKQGWDIVEDYTDRAHVSKNGSSFRPSKSTPFWAFNIPSDRSEKCSFFQTLIEAADG
jgi:hypothetical protein